MTKDASPTCILLLSYVADNIFQACPITESSSLEFFFIFRYIGISENVVLAFRKEMIDGYMLVELTDDILEEDFHLSKLYRFKIKRFIQGWRPKLSTS